MKRWPRLEQVVANIKEMYAEWKLDREQKKFFVWLESYLNKEQDGFQEERLKRVNVSS